MASSWAQRQAARHRALADAAAPPAPPAVTALDRMLARLRDHLGQLRAIQSMQARAQQKAAWLHDYLAYVDGVLEGDTGRQDPVVVQMMIWAVDGRDYSTAVRLAAYVLRHGLAMPEGFERAAPTWIVEELARAAGDDARALPALEEAMSLTASLDMPDPVRAKGWRALGQAVAERDPALAIEWLQKALDLDRQVGVKRELERLKKQVAESDTEAVDED